MTREMLTFASLDEAVAEALRDAPAGDIVEVHGTECDGREESDPPYDVIGCTCEPMVLVVGAEA